MTRAMLLALALVASISVMAGAASAADECQGSGGLTGVAVGCLKSGSETSEYIAGHSDHTYSIRPACEVGGTASCAAPATCNIERHDGFLYNVYQDDDPDPLGWQACLTKQEAKHLGGVTPAMVEHAFRRLAWPASELVVQPPNGKTLVNFDTNFYTTNTAPTTQTVTLLGRPVTIEATPTQYTWHFGGVGEGTAGDLSTTDPGAAYPDLRVTHRYTRTGAVQPSVDTTYAGRYRVGNGGWRNIPANLTVPGVRVDLQVVSATPHLVGY